MTTITPALTTTSSTAPASTANALNQLSGNFDSFLQLLTTQLQNQDPTSPMSSTQFTQQLVAFSQVEQQINTNSNLQTLINLSQSNGTSNAVSYLGKTVTLTNGEAPLSGGVANWDYTLGSNAAATTLTVTDASNNVVYVGSGQTTAGTHPFTWNGQDNSGNQLPDGTYKLTVSATGSSGVNVSSAVSTSGPVTQVDLSGSTPQLMMGGMEFPLSSVSAVSG
jgi:flagellar basal-body rod modification protein FlgD